MGAVRGILPRHGQVQAQVQAQLQERITVAVQGIPPRQGQTKERITGTALGMPCPPPSAEELTTTEAQEMTHQPQPGQAKGPVTEVTAEEEKFHRLEIVNELIMVAAQEIALLRQPGKAIELTTEAAQEPVHPLE